MSGLNLSVMNVNNYNFEYFDKGKGKTLMFVHGSVSDYRTWKKQRESLEKNYRVITYSRRFHWPNEKISENEDYSMHQHVADLEEILHKINEPVHLIGHSYGAFICLLLAMKSPHLIQTLILAEPPVITLYVSNDPKPHEIIRLLFTRHRTALALMKLGSKAFEPARKEIRKDNVKKAVEYFGTAVLGKEAYSKLSGSRRSQVYQNFIKAEFSGTGFPPLKEEQIRKIKTPTLLIAGEKSPEIFHLLLGRLKELMPNSQIKIIPAASHISHEDNADFYNNEL